MIYRRAGRAWGRGFWPDLGLSRGRASNLEVGPGMDIPRPGPRTALVFPLSFSGMRGSHFYPFFFFFFSGG